jgi:hypothetical protein
LEILVGRMNFKVEGSGREGFNRFSQISGDEAFIKLE